MTQENRGNESKRNSETNTRNSLITKIALFLNYLTKDNHEKLVRNMKKYEIPSQIDILKIMRAKKYVTPQDLIQLKKTCLSFAKAQEDNRFGSLCIDFEFLTQSNLNLAIEEQSVLARSGQNIMLGNLLVDAGMLSERQRNLVLHKQKLESSGRKSARSNRGKDSKPPEFDKANMREIRESNIIILVRNDALKAFIQKTNKFKTDMTIEDLKSLLEKNGIIYGIENEARLKAFIKNDMYQQMPFEVAKGLKSIDGIDAQIIYLFERDYLKAGHMANDGSIDFKERGKIPFVKQGDILSEKIPPKEGKDGINIYGDAILKSEALDKTFIIGKGVYLSEDGLKVVSDAKGNPKVKPGGEISVNDAYFIEGDVDYTTGHIKFDKNVFITGTIKSGFRVEAIDVVANTIDGGIVKAQGDVFVENGVTESSIQAKGNIKAGFMHRSDAACMGDLHIVKEIADTKVTIEGTFEMPKGRMFSSIVCAKGGTKVYSIGSERAKSSTITVGTSIYLEKELASINQDIENRQNLLERKTTDKSKIDAQLNEIDGKLSSYDKSRQRILGMIQQMRENSPKNSGSQIELFQKSIDETDKTIHSLNQQKTSLKTQQKDISKTIERCTEAVKVSVKEKFTLKRLNEKNPSKPIVDVSGKIFAGTRINGRYASLIISHSLNRSKIMEMGTDAGNGSKKEWEIVVTGI